MKNEIVVGVALPREKTFSLVKPYKYVLHLDFDYPIPDHWLTTWKIYKSTMLETMGFHVDRIIIKDPKDVDAETRKTVYKGRKGKHLWVHITSPAKLSEDAVNMLQWMLCDDATRVWINSMRIDRKIRRWWNKLFTRHVWTRPISKICQKCKIRAILYEMKKEMDKNETDNR